MVDIEDKLEQYAEANGNSLQEIEEVFEDKREEVEDKAGGLPDDKKESMAFSLVRSETIQKNSVPRSSEETQIVAIGDRGIIEDMGDNNDDTLITYGVVDPADDDRPRRPSVILNEESSGVDLWDVKEKFQSMNTLSAEYDVQDSTKVDGVYVLHATEETDPEVLDTDMTQEETRQWVNDNFFDEPAKLAEIGSHVSQGARDGFPDLFGADLKRIEGTVVDWFISQDGETGGYILQDDSVIDPSDYPEEVVGDERVPGLTCWTDPGLMEYGENSICDFYGSISVMDDGQVTMNVVGIAPIMANEIEFDSDQEPASSTEDKAEETTI